MSSLGQEAKSILLANVAKMELASTLKANPDMSDFLSASDLWDLASSQSGNGICGHQTSHPLSWEGVFQAEPPVTSQQYFKFQSEGISDQAGQEFLAIQQVEGVKDLLSSRLTQPLHFSTPKRTGRLFTKFQIDQLERRFQQWQYVSNEKADGLASDLGITGTQVKTWFTNRRSKAKHPSSKSRCAQLSTHFIKDSLQPKTEKSTTVRSSLFPADINSNKKDRKKRSVKQKSGEDVIPEACDSSSADQQHSNDSLASSVNQKMYCGATIQCSSKLQALLMLPSHVSSSQLNLQTVLSASSKVPIAPIKREDFGKEEETGYRQTVTSYDPQTDRYDPSMTHPILPTNPFNDFLGLSNGSYPNQQSPLSTTSLTIMDSEMQMMDVGLNNYEHHHDYVALYSGCGLASTGFGMPSHMDSASYYAACMGCPIDPFLLNQYY